MEFCPNCGGMILPQEVGEEDDKKIVLKCSTCGYDSTEVDKAEYSIEKKVESKETVIMRGDESGLRSTVREICPKCGKPEVLMKRQLVSSLVKNAVINGEAMIN